MAGFFHDLTHPTDGNMTSFTVTVNDVQQCVVVQLDGDGKPCDFTVCDDLEDLARVICEGQAGDDGYTMTLACKANGDLCGRLFDKRTWQEVADTRNGPDGKDKWVMDGKCSVHVCWPYITCKNGVYHVTDLGKKLDAMQSAEA